MRVTANRDGRTIKSPKIVDRALCIQPIGKNGEGRLLMNRIDPKPSEETRETNGFETRVSPDHMREQ
jgi:hypothetical protein